VHSRMLRDLNDVGEGVVMLWCDKAREDDERGLCPLNIVTQQ
jgi:hypothetical protein